MAAAMRRENFSATYAFAAAAQRCPDRPAFVDDRGMLTWRQLDQRCDALAAALQALPAGQPETIGIMCRNHRGFVEALVASHRIGADVLLLNTSFAAPALLEILDREGADAIVYDEEFTDAVIGALGEKPSIAAIIGWSEESAAGSHTVEKLINDSAGQRPKPADEEEQNHPADVGYYRHTQGRQTRQRRPHDARWRSRAHTVARGGDRRHRGADVSRVGLWPVAFRCPDGVHDRDASQIRSRGNTETHRRAHGQWGGRGARHARPNHGAAGADPQSLQLPVAAVRRRVRITFTP